MSDDREQLTEEQQDDLVDVLNALNDEDVDDSIKQVLEILVRAESLSWEDLDNLVDDAREWSTAGPLFYPEQFDQDRASKVEKRLEAVVTFKERLDEINDRWGNDEG